MAVCSDMLEIVLAPIAPLACKSNAAQASPRNDSDAAGEGSGPMKNVNTIEEEPAEHKPNAAGGSHGDKHSRFHIKKPWVTCLAENKKIWKEQAVRGK